ncbi:IS701 family transposase [Actinomadura spongiicola]|uniref:IS701 family transposase n=1 Tax=Actinomadura spongiicola TaxID=2303421 RepID=UPI00131445C4|nr:IS701 family transposase [Actinomadura spongiicola]
MDPLRVRPGSPRGLGPARPPVPHGAYADRTELMLRRLHRSIAPRFARAEPRDRAFAFLRGMVSSAERRNGRRLAENAGEPRPDGMQRLLTSARWSADALRDDLRDVIVEHLGDPRSVLVLNEAGFSKKGDRSVGVSPQLSPSTGVVENCQVAVFLTYSAPRAQAIVDRELYLPTRWARDPARRARARVPADVPYRDRGLLGREMIRRAVAARTPASWVAASSPYGQDAELRRWLTERGVPHVLGVRPDERLLLPLDGRTVQAVPEEIIAGIPPRDWLPTPDHDDPVRRSSVCHSARALLRRGGDRRPAQWLLVRRDIRRTRVYLCSAPPSASLRELVDVARRAERAPSCVESARHEVGLDHYEVRLWKAWYRYITLALLAHACVTLAAEDAPPANARAVNARAVNAPSMNAARLRGVRLA